MSYLSRVRHCHDCIPKGGLRTLLAAAFIFTAVSTSMAVVCSPGYYDASGTCTECPIMTYKTSSDSSTSCDSCPDNLICPYNGLQYPLTELGYWTSNSDPLVAEICLPKLACPNNGILVPRGRRSSYICSSGSPNECEDGYVGEACSICDSGYYRSYGVCFRCLPDYDVFVNLEWYDMVLVLWEKILFLWQMGVIAVLAATPFVLCFYRVAFKSSFIQNYENLIMGANRSLFLMTQVFRLAQVASIVLLLDIQWPFFFDLFSFLALSVRDGPLWVASRGSTRTCWETVSSTEEVNNTFVNRGIAYCGLVLLVGLLMILVTAILWCLDALAAGRKRSAQGLQSLMKRENENIRKENMKTKAQGRVDLKAAKGYRKRRICTPVDVCLQYSFRLVSALYLAIHERALSIFSCAPRGDNKGYAMTFYPSMDCFSSEWYRLLPWSAALIVVVSFGAPLVYMATTFIGHRMRHKEAVASKLSFLWKDFDHSFYWFEGLTFMYKFLVGCVHLMRFRGVEEQIVYLLFVTLGYFSISTRSAPYLAGRHDGLTFFTDMTALWVLLLGLIYLDQSERQTAGDLLTNPIESTFLALASLFVVWTLAYYVFTFFVDTARMFGDGDVERPNKKRMPKGGSRLEDKLIEAEKKRVMGSGMASLEPKYQNLLKSLDGMQKRLGIWCLEVHTGSSNSHSDCIAAFDNFRDFIINIKQLSDMVVRQEAMIEEGDANSVEKGIAVTIEDESKHEGRDKTVEPDPSEPPEKKGKNVVANATLGQVNAELGLEKIIKLNQTDNTIKSDDEVYVDRGGMKYFRETNRGYNYYSQHRDHAEKAAQEEADAIRKAREAAEALKKKSSVGKPEVKIEEKVDEEVTPFKIVRDSTDVEKNGGKEYKIGKMTALKMENPYDNSQLQNYKPTGPSIEDTPTLKEESIFSDIMPPADIDPSILRKKAKHNQKSKIVDKMRRASQDMGLD